MEIACSVSVSLAVPEVAATNEQTARRALHPQGSPVAWFLECAAENLIASFRPVQIPGRLPCHASGVSSAVRKAGQPLELAPLLSGRTPVRAIRIPADMVQVVRAEATTLLMSAHNEMSRTQSHSSSTDIHLIAMPFDVVVTGSARRR